MIHPIHFYDLLDCLAGQFFNPETNFALCTGKKFGIQISPAAQEYFTVAVVPKELPGERVVLGQLSDDSAKIASRDGFTFTVYLDTGKIKNQLNNNAAMYRIIVLSLLAHEICHFAYYYELFVQLGGNPGLRETNAYTYQVSDGFFGSVIRERDITSQTNFDEHNLPEFINNFGRYDKKHFAKGGSSRVNFNKTFRSFIKHLNL